MSGKFKFLKWHGKKAVAVLVLALLLTVTIIGATVAFVVVYTDSLHNVFAPATIEIDLDDNGNVKNIGDAEVYVRVAVVVNWESTESTGTINSKAPEEGTDYTVGYGSDWVLGSDGFYYYTKPLDVNASVVHPTVTESGTALGGYELSVDILADAVQATPAAAVTESWSAIDKVNGDGTLSVILAN